MVARIADDSLRCLGALPNPKISSTADIGWTSLLLDHVSGEARSGLFETHATPDLTIVVATRGEHDIDVHSDGRWRHAVQQPGAVSLTRPSETTRLRWSVRHPSRTFASAHLYLPGGLLDEAEEHLRRAGERSRRRDFSALVFRDPMIAAAVQGLLRAQANGAPDIYAQQVGQRLATHLLCSASTSPGEADDRHPGVLSDRRLARTVECMSARFGDQVTVDELAAEAGISKFHFVRLFKEKVGMTPHAHLAEIRLSTARRLVRTTDLPLAQIGAECGYTRPSAFAAAFNRRFGRAPSSLRRE